ncbi:MAG TPA: response regulator transcription factor [Rubrobacteraceae bacterium]|nr:response regulator transcription factor [Rubrobacteraceae bacterium]
MAEILVVEDDEAILNTLAYNLVRQGFGVQKATSGIEALRLARKMRPDLILLDIMLPGESGIEVCERIRKDDQEVVIVMVTAKDQEEDKVRGFEAGADDYVTKPFGMKELVARISANLKRSSMALPGARGSIIEAGELKSREELAKEVWGHAGVGFSRTIDVHIRRLRAALAEKKSDYEYVHTVRGLGYRFEVRSGRPRR